MPEKKEYNNEFMHELMRNIKKIMKMVKANILDELWYDKEKLEKINELVNKIFSNESLSEQDKNFKNSLSKKYIKILKHRGIEYLKKIISLGNQINSKAHKELINTLTQDDLSILKEFTEYEINKRQRKMYEINNDKKNKINKNESIERTQQEIDNLKEFQNKLSVLIRWDI